MINCWANNASIPYNLDIANAFFRAGMIESWGRGIERILSACQEANSPEPIIRTEATGVWIEFSFPETVAKENKTTQETTQEKIRALIRNNPAITRREMAEKIGLSTNGIKYHLQKMSKTGIISHVGATKTGHWMISSFYKSNVTTNKSNQ